MIRDIEINKALMPFIDIKLFVFTRRLKK